jgi:SET domain-containing protein
MNSGDHSAILFTAKSTIHGLGCFSSNQIAEGEIVGEYIGERIDLAEAIRRNDRSTSFYSDYILQVDEELFIDGTGRDSPLRFMNHSCDPNCHLVRCDQRVFIAAERDISEGEELTLDYCLDPDVSEECQCGSPGCRGFM